MLPPPVQTYFAAHSKNDPHSLEAILAEGAVGHVNGREVRGAAAVRDELAALAAAFPDANYTVQDGVREADRVAVRWELSGTHRAPYLGRPATGNRVRLGGLTLFRLDPAQGRITELWSHWDPAPRGA